MAYRRFCAYADLAVMSRSRYWRGVYAQRALYHYLLALEKDHG
jgi:hypothetical protein